MSDNKPPKVVHHAGEFQLPHHKEAGVEVGMIGDTVFDKVVDAANDADFNHDGVSDVSQIAPVVLKLLPVAQAALPILQELAPELNAEGIKAWVLSHGKDFFHDAANAEKKLVALTPAIQKLAEAGKEVALKFAPKV